MQRKLKGEKIMRRDSEMVNLRSVIEMLCYMVDDDSDGVEEIMQLPTIDLVRCKECKWYDDKDYGEPTRYCTWHESVVYAEDFCSYGERIEE